MFFSKHYERIGYKQVRMETNKKTIFATKTYLVAAHDAKNAHQFEVSFKE